MGPVACINECAPMLDILLDGIGQEVIGHWNTCHPFYQYLLMIRAKLTTRSS